MKPSPHKNKFVISALGPSEEPETIDVPIKTFAKIADPFIRILPDDKRRTVAGAWYELTAAVMDALRSVESANDDAEFGLKHSNLNVAMESIGEKLQSYEGVMKERYEAYNQTFEDNEYFYNNVYKARIDCEDLDALKGYAYLIKESAKVHYNKFGNEDVYLMLTKSLAAIKQTSSVNWQSEVWVDNNPKFVVGS